MTWNQRNDNTHQPSLLFISVALYFPSLTIVWSSNPSRIADRVLRRTRQPLPATGLLPGSSCQPDFRKKWGRSIGQHWAPDDTEERVPAEGAALHRQRPASERQHDRLHRPAEKAATSSGEHWAGSAALVLLWKAPHRQDPPAGHQDPEGFCHPGHREPADTKPIRRSGQKG